MCKSRWTSWAPVPNKPTVSVDVKQHFNHQPEGDGEEARLAGEGGGGQTKEQRKEGSKERTGKQREKRKAKSNRPCR